MTSSEKWICDGVPKNGKHYENSNPHQSHENYAPDCEICGLPKEAMNSQGKKVDSPKLPIIAAGVAAVLALGGVATYLVVGRGCQAGLQKIAGQCVDPYLQSYQDAVQEGNEAINIADNYKSIEDLEKAQINLANAVTNLSQIPAEASIYPEVKTVLAEYNQYQENIKTSIQKEKMARMQLTQAETIAKEATSQTKIATTATQLTAAKQKWQEAKNKLKEIDSSTTVNSQVEQYTSNYDQQIKNIDERIAAIAKQSLPSNSESATYQPQLTAPTKQPSSVNPPKPKPKSTPTYSQPCVDNQDPNCVF